MPPLPNRSNIGAKDISVVVVVVVIFFLISLLAAMIIPYYSYHLSVPKLGLFPYLEMKFLSLSSSQNSHS